MPPRADTLTCDQAAELLEPFVDGELDPTLAAALSDHAQRCAGCGEQLRLANLVKDGLGAMPCLDMSPQALAELRRRTRDEPRRHAWWHSLAAAVGQLPPLLRAAAAVASVALIGAVVLALVHGPGSTAGPTRAEVTKARAEARLALALIGAASRQTAVDLRREVLTERVLNPTARSLGISLHPGLAPQPEASAGPTGSAGKGSST